ncbi:hypothetical protein [Jatrophihabitans sp.]|uniref:hypothetical protein n=1 Tax=Jatrophihabitans sp. TaxID=1932789 RepID=UPI0038CD9033
MLRALVRVTFKGLANDASIAVLTIVLTVVGAYGVYVAQSADNKSRRTEGELRLIEAERLKVAALQRSLESTLKEQAHALEDAQRRGHILSLKQTILAGMPEVPPSAENSGIHTIIRRIVLDAVSREDLSQALFDCDEAVAAAETHGVNLSGVLGKGTLAFLEYHRIASSGK